MTSRTYLGAILLLTAAFNVSACAKQTPPATEPAAAAPADEQASASVVSEHEEAYVEGVAGGVMFSTVTLRATIVSVDPENRSVVLEGEEGHQWTASVGKDAIKLYHHAAGEAVELTVSRELVVYVPEGETEADSSEVSVTTQDGAGESELDVVETTQVTTTITGLDATARTVILLFPDGAEGIFHVRPDVDMSAYSVGQNVVFLMTDMLAVGIGAQ